MRKVLIDSSSAILLYKAGACEHLMRIFSVCAARSVYHELTVPGRQGSGFFCRAAADGTIEFYDPEPDKTESLPASLHAGERETIALYLSGAGDYIILDDRKAAVRCRAEGIPFINALLALRILYLSEEISGSDFAEKNMFLRQSGRYSGKVIDFAESAGMPELSFFMPRLQEI